MPHELPATAWARPTSRRGPRWAPDADPSGRSGRGWTRASDLSCVKRALCAAELLARAGSGTRNRTSASTFRTWRPAARRSRNESGASLAAVRSVGEPDRQCRALRPPRLSEVDAAARQTPFAGSRSVSSVRSRTMLSKPLANPSTLDRRFRRPTWRSFGARRSYTSSKTTRRKQRHLFSSDFPASTTQRTFLSQAGPRVLFVFPKLGITLSRCGSCS